MLPHTIRKVSALVLPLCIMLTFSAAADPYPSGSDGEVSILFGGDTYFGEHHFSAVERQGEPNLLTEKGYFFSLEHLLPLLHASDYVVLNLETPILDRLDRPQRQERSS